MAYFSDQKDLSEESPEMRLFIGGGATTTPHSAELTNPELGGPLSPPLSVSETVSNLQ